MYVVCWAVAAAAARPTAQGSGDPLAPKATGSALCGAKAAGIAVCGDDMAAGIIVLDR